MTYSVSTIWGWTGIAHIAGFMRSRPQINDQVDSLYQSIIDSGSTSDSIFSQLAISVSPHLLIMLGQYKNDVATGFIT